MQMEANEFYAPDLFHIIVDYLHLWPLWTCIMISPILQMNPLYKQTTRLSNNPVEGWFRHLKNSILKKRRVMPSELVADVYRRLEMKYKEFYCTQITTSNGNIFYAYNFNNNSIVLNWILIIAVQSQSMKISDDHEMPEINLQESQEPS